jgi:type IV pilus assembly protein PilV
VSLVEVLVSLFIVSMGVLALAGLVSAAARLGKSGESRAAATLLANDMADRLRANPAGASSLGYDWRPAAYPARVAPPTPPARLEPGCTSGAPCDPSAIAAIDLFRWRQRLFHALPGGYGYVQYHPGTADAASTVDVWVAWSDATSLVYGEALPARECPSAFGAPGATGTPRCVYLQVAL